MVAKTEIWQICLKLGSNSCKMEKVKNGKSQLKSAQIEKIRPLYYVKYHIIYIIKWSYFCDTASSFRFTAYLDFA